MEPPQDKDIAFPKFCSSFDCAVCSVVGRAAVGGADRKLLLQRPIVLASTKAEYKTENGNMKEKRKKTKYWEIISKPGLSFPCRPRL